MVGTRTLFLKLLRDMWRSRMQFIAIILLCALGTWVFSGLDAAWRMLDVSINKYFTEQRLADMWIGIPNADRGAMDTVRRIEGVKDAQARVNLELTAALPHEPTLITHAYDGAARINVPLIRKGAALGGGDTRGCVLEEQFALANGLDIGDELRLKLGGAELSFIVRGLALSPEHVITAKDVMPDPVNYGFVILNASAVPAVRLNEIVMTLEAGADEKEVKRETEKAFKDALVVDHQAHQSTQRTESDVTMFRNLSYVFPILAFAVAALIVLTTITRMIESQRVQMGTLKSLGYHDGAITLHYLCYAIIPSIIGAALGLFTGRYTLPYILWDMEAESYILPYQLQAPISDLSLIMCAMCVLLACAMCLIAYRSSAREVTAALLRPKPPKAGSRLLLERMGFLWRRLRFNSKMVVRSLFRSKGRTLMSLIGVLCCTMLIITSLGLQDSVKYFVGNYYQGTLGYDVRADLDSSAGELSAYRKRLSAELVEGVMERTVSLRARDSSKTTMLTIVQEGQQLLRLGEGESRVPVPEKGVMVTSKIATALDLTVGDDVSLWLPGDGEPINTVVSGIAYVNIGQGAYMARNDWEAQKKGAFIPTALLLKAPSDAAIQALEDMDECEKLRWPKQEFEETLTILQSMMGVFTLMSGAALGLAFVILYNMGILNFMERYREYATLKVLGYHQREIRRLMIRENVIIAGAGVLLGTVPGRWLTTVVLKSCESEEMVFASTVEPRSYIIACAVTFVFSFLLQLLLTRKVNTIDMVEALKSVE